MAGKKNTVTLSTDKLVETIDEIKAIDEKLVTIKGTAAEWMKQGTAAARATFLAEFAGLDGAPVEHVDGDVVTGRSVTFWFSADSTVGDYLDNFTAHVQDIEQFGNELAGAWIKANRTDSDESVALRERRAELVTSAESMRNIFSQLLPDEDLPEIPAAPKSGRSSGTSSRSTKAGAMTFYRVIDGERVYQPSSQDSLSSLAYYYFKSAETKVRASVGDLRDALAKQHGKVDETADWENTVELNGNTVTIGWHLVKADEPADDDKPAE